MGAIHMGCSQNYGPLWLWIIWRHLILSDLNIENYPYCWRYQGRTHHGPLSNKLRPLQGLDVLLRCMGACDKPHFEKLRF